MNRNRQHATWLGAVLGTVCALFVLALGAHASDHRGALTEEFHQTYAITADGRIELGIINGSVHIPSWDRNEVKVPAGNVNCAIDVVEFNPAVGCDGVCLMEFLSESSSMIGRVRSQGEDKQGANGPQNSSQPRGMLAIAIHGSLPFNALDVLDEDS